MFGCYVTGLVSLLLPNAHDVFLVLLLPLVPTTEEFLFNISIFTPKSSLEILFPFASMTSLFPDSPFAPLLISSHPPSLPTTVSPSFTVQLCWLCPVPPRSLVGIYSEASTA